MNFRLIYKKLGVKSIDVFSEFESPSNIKDVYFVKDIGFLCLDENSLMLVTDKGCSQILSLDNPMSICAGLVNSVYVLYNGGIKNINYVDNYYSRDILGNTEYSEIFGRLSKTKIDGMSMDSYEGVIVVCVPSINKFYKIRKNTIEEEYGTGVPEYSIANRPSRCSLYNPQGILVYDSDTTFVSDTGNGCIRSFGKTHRIITGNPLVPTIKPTKLLIDRKKDILYYLSKNYLRSVFVNGDREALLYESDHMISMALGCDNKIYALEEKK